MKAVKNLHTWSWWVMKSQDFLILKIMWAPPAIASWFYGRRIRFYATFGSLKCPNPSKFSNLAFYTSQGCIMVSKLWLFFLQLAWKNICRLFRPGLWDDQWGKCLWVCNKNKSGTTSISKYVPMCTKTCYICSLIWSLEFFFSPKF